MSDMRTREQQIQSYVEKSDYLTSLFGEPVRPHEFYRAMFPEGCLQSEYKADGNAKDGKYDAVINVVCERKRDGSLYRRNKPLFNELRQVVEPSTTDRIAFVAPCDFLSGTGKGKGNRWCKKDNDHLRNLYAFVVDLDYVGLDQLKNLFHQMCIGYVPAPSFIVNSGTGLHLYYLLDKPVNCWKNKQAGYSALKHALIAVCWNSDTSQQMPRQYSGLVQPYRVIGSRSKLDCDPLTERVTSKDYTVQAWKCLDEPQRWSIEELLNFEPSIDLELGDFHRYIEVAKKELGYEQDPDKLTLEKAKELYPKWYHERIELQMPAKPVEEWKWKVKPDLYQWWLRRIRTEAEVGHRYFCVMMLAVYAIKCDIPFKQLYADAYSLFDEFESRTNDETNHFKKSDIEAALRAYWQKGYATLPINSIQYFSGLRIDKAKRNYREQADHLAVARSIKTTLNQLGIGNAGNAGRPQGSKDSKPRTRTGDEAKAKAIRDYKKKHPQASQRAIAAALGVSPTTVNKVLKN